ncbi:MAG: hypothetical protein KBC95_03160 [Candidatus Peribacteraceae bacterium]|nr:hypothetical protein [Candidatus Peribacteraceae bacterium]
MPNEVSLNGPDQQPPTPEAASEFAPRSNLNGAASQRLQRVSQFANSFRNFGLLMGFGPNAAARREAGTGRMGTFVGGPNSSSTIDRGRRVYTQFRRGREGRERIPEPRFDRRDQLQPSPSPISTSEAPMSEEDLRNALATLNVGGQPLAFPGPLTLASDATVLGYMRRNNIPPTRYRALLSNLQRASEMLPAALQARPEIQGASVAYSCDGNRVWATWQLGGRQYSAFATGTQVMFVDGPPALPGRGPIRVVTAGGVPMAWNVTASGSNTYEGNGRLITERMSTGSSTFEMREGGRVASAGFFSTDGIFIARANFAQAPLPNPRSLDGARADSATIRVASPGMYLYIPDQSRLPPAYRAIAEQYNGWLPPPSVLLAGGSPQEIRTKEQQLLAFAASLDLETSNAWLTGIFVGTQEQEPWNLIVSNLRFDRRRGNYRGLEGLRNGVGGCMQVADLGVQILRRRGYTAVALRVEHDHAAAVALQPVAGGYQLIVYDSMGVHFRPPAASPVAALMGAWQDDRHARPAMAEFIDDNMNAGTISYEALAARMSGGPQMPASGPTPPGRTPRRT